MLLIRKQERLVLGQRRVDMWQVPARLPRLPFQAPSIKPIAFQRLRGKTEGSVAADRCCCHGGRSRTRTRPAQPEQASRNRHPGCRVVDGGG
eukprot:2709393-Pleurochrysis_carterae.AAC.3